MKVLARIAAYGFIVASATTAVVSGRIATAMASPPQDDCAVVAPDAEPIASIALSGTVTPANAPRPTNEAERLLFRQLYETLVRVDCMGRVRPGLASSWQLSPEGDWLLTLREDARFADGTIVTPADVVLSWTGNVSTGQLRPDVARIVESVATTAAVVIVTLRQRGAGEPTALAHTDLAITKPAADSPWPLGTKGARVSGDGDKPRNPRAAMMTVSRGDASPLRVLAAPGDPRDLLDEGVDLLLTRDPATLDYARTRSEVQLVPLAWQQMRVMLAPGRGSQAAGPSESARQVLADDAVRGEARGAQEPFWWRSVSGCAIASLPPRASAPVPRIVYDAGDGAARDLAERFVGLGRAAGPAAANWLEVLLPDRSRRSFQRAVGLTGAPLAQARRLGGDAGYLLSVDSRPLAPCRELQALMDVAPWLNPEAIVPLVETRLHAIVRRGRSGLVAEWDGGVLIASSTPPKPE